jgi:uncharacterized protein YcaQ
VKALTTDEVRHVLLQAQGLGEGLPATAAKADVMAAIRRMRALQIDTINVVARSPYLVVWSRLGAYEPCWLDELLAGGNVFEYWAHAACFLPREDFGLYRRQMIDRTNRVQQRWGAWLDANRALADRVLGRIRDEGALRSADFERTDGRRGGGWWDWKEEKVALEALLTAGELMVARRENFQRVYDLTHRVRPGWDDRAAPDAEAMRRELVRQAAGALGVARAEWIARYAFLGQPVRPVAALIRAMAAAGDLEEASVEGWAAPGYALPGTVGATRDAAAGSTVRTALLSPFDPIVRDRERLAALFRFDYRIECYTPAPKRRYGYFTLPILHGDRIVGRLDPKAHRQQGIMEIKSITLEPGVALDDRLVAGLRTTLCAFADWHGTPELVVVETQPQQLKQALRPS